MSRDIYKNNHGEIPKRLDPTANTIKDLFLKSGNECAYPNCNNNMYDGNYIGQICHIEDAMPGDRYNPDKTNEQNREETNLMLMCYEHHVETNDIEKYPVIGLKEMKFEHEQSILNRKKSTPSSISVKNSNNVRLYNVHATNGGQVNLEGLDDFTMFNAKADGKTE